MHTVTLEEAKALLPELVAEVSQGGEVVIIQNNTPVARLARAVVEDAPVAIAHAALCGFLKGRIILKDGWDEPLEEMRPYLE